MKFYKIQTKFFRCFRNTVSGDRVENINDDTFLISSHKRSLQLNLITIKIVAVTPSCTSLWTESPRTSLRNTTNQNDENDNKKSLLCRRNSRQNTSVSSSHLRRWNHFENFLQSRRRELCFVINDDLCLSNRNLCLHRPARVHFVTHDVLVSFAVCWSTGTPRQRVVREICSIQCRKVAFRETLPPG